MLQRPDSLSNASLTRLNEMSESEARQKLLAVCGSERWVNRMIARRPFASVDAVYSAADEEWFGLEKQDWLEAFSHHPRIGERNLAQPKFAATASQSSREQSGMAGASEDVRKEFAVGNAEYEKRFGHVFLICATGKTGEEMLGSLRERLKNDGATELRNAAEEQSKIVRIRLGKLVEE
ncbi:MAG: 2-oxo-4-hydroxy-4-carboxy-5-ureidoimidazoline decarboxylase [Planctomycetes bacterium]|nr:2-oxo-4-hydroxy-4-carboxy-5-ureidoimidazoline decarboxylase [Planctomycetota bacterium]